MRGAWRLTAELRRGVVAAVFDNPAAALLELDTGALVPLTFVLGWDGPGVLVADTPLGLFDDGSA